MDYTLASAYDSWRGEKVSNENTSSVVVVRTMITAYQIAP